MALTLRSTLLKDQMLPWWRIKRWSFRETVTNITELMSLLQLFRAWKLNSTHSRLKREGRTLTLKTSTTLTKPWWIETSTLSQSMRLYRSIPPFWPSKIRTYRENLTPLSRPMTLSEETSIVRRKWTILDTTWTVPSKRAWTKSLDPDPQPSKATMLARAGMPLNSTPPRTIDQRATTTNSLQLELSQRAEAH